ERDFVAVQIEQGEGGGGPAAELELAGGGVAGGCGGLAGDEIDAALLLGLHGAASLAQVLPAGPDDERDSGGQHQQQERSSHHFEEVLPRAGDSLAAVLRVYRVRG